MVDLAASELAGAFLAIMFFGILKFIFS